AATAAHARSDVYFSVGLPSSAYVQPAPVYVNPRGPWGDRDGDGIANAYDRHDNRFDHRRHNLRNVGLYGPNGDFDRDGVPNRFDRFPDNPYRR
ncbi:MAG: hypothetical protein ABI907_08340, partial [Ramlibacter sp.]